MNGADERGADVRGTDVRGLLALLVFATATAVGDTPWSEVLPTRDTSLNPH